MQIAIHTITAELNKDIEINVSYDNAHVFTSYSEDKKTKYLSIKIKKEIGDTESLNVVEDSITWFKLLILDVFCYFSNEPLTLRDFYKSETVIGSFEKVEKNVFLVNGESVLSDLDKMIDLWEKADKKVKNDMIIKMRMNRYNIIEKSGKKL